MTRREAAEIIIVGAGPAGSALALQAARSGRDVQVLERARFPRDKACGDCLNPGAVAELDRLGIAGHLRDKLAPRPLRGWRVEAPDGTAFRAEFGELTGGAVSEGWAVRRRDFDAALLDEAVRAGARVEFGVGVFGLLVNGGGRVVGVRARYGSDVRDIQGRIVVGADGLRSVVQRRLSLQSRPARLRKIAIVGHLERPDGAAFCGELRVRDGRACGYAALPGGANLTLVVPQAEAGAAAGDPRGFLLAALSAFPEVEERVRARGLERAVLVTGPFDRPVRRMWSPGALLVGDAAGYYDPFTGQGIHQALRSAALAAEAVRWALDEPAAERAAFERYERRLRRRLTPSRALQRVIEAAISRPGVMSSAVGRLSRSESIAARRLLRATGDVAHPATLFDPRIWLRLALSPG